MGVLEKNRRKMTSALKEQKRREWWQKWTAPFAVLLFWAVKEKAQKKGIINWNFHELWPKMISAGFKGGPAVLSICGADVYYDRRRNMVSLGYERAEVRITGERKEQELTGSTLAVPCWDERLAEEVCRRIVVQRKAPVRVKVDALIELQGDTLFFRSV